MKKIKCEICGGTDLVKKDGSFICQNCGTGYSVEEMQKIVQGQKVDASGSVVKIDIESEVSNLLSSAHLYLKRKEYWEASEIFEDILKKDSKNWEAAFFSVYCASMDISSVNKLNKNNTLVFDIITKLPKSEQENAISVITKYTIRLAESYYKQLEHSREILRDSYHFGGEEKNSIFVNGELAEKLLYLQALLFDLADLIEDIHKKNNLEVKQSVLTLLKQGISYTENTLALVTSLELKKRIISDIQKYIEQITRYEPSYTISDSSSLNIKNILIDPEEKKEGNAPPKEKDLKDLTDEELQEQQKSEKDTVAGGIATVLIFGLGTLCNTYDLWVLWLIITCVGLSVLHDSRLKLKKIEEELNIRNSKKKPKKTKNVVKVSKKLGIKEKIRPFFTKNKKWIYSSVGGLVFLAIIIVTVFVVVQPKVYTCKIDADCNLDVVTNSNTQQPITGIVNSYYKNGILEITASYKNGRKDGVCKRYSEQGELRFEVSYKDGLMHGVAKNYAAGGVRLEIPYSNGKVDGILKLYNGKDRLGYEVSYKEGKKDGHSKIYNPDGSVMVVFTYKNDILYGDAEEFDRDGKLVNKTFWKNLNRDILSTWDEAVELLNEIIAKENLQVLQADEFTGNALEEEKTKYTDGSAYNPLKDKMYNNRDAISGKVKEYICGSNAECDSNLITDSKTGQPITGIVKKYSNADGYLQLTSETSVLNGKKNGLSKEYDKNGIMRKLISYRYGALVGDTKEYYASGKLKIVYPFKNDKLNGTVKKYDERGTVIAEIEYVDGEKKETRINEDILPKKVEKKTPPKNQVRKGKVSEWNIERYSSIALPDWTGYAAALTNQIYNKCAEDNIVDSNTKWAVSVEKHHFSIIERDLSTIKKEIENLLKEQSVVKIVQNPNSAKYQLMIILDKEREGNTLDTEFSVIKVFLYDNDTEEYVVWKEVRFKEGQYFKF